MYIHVLKEIFLEFSPEKLLDKMVDFFHFCRKFLRVGSPLCSNSPYAVLRGDVKLADDLSNDSIDDSESVVEDDRENSPIINEENNLKTEELPENEEKNAEIVSKNEKEDVNISQTEMKNENKNKIKIIPDEEPPKYVSEEKEETVIKNDTKTSYSALIKMESLLDSDVEEAYIESNDDLKEAIYRLCDKFEGRPLPQNLVKCVVSLTTPRDILSTTPLEPPAFVEFSLSEDGYSCLFIPALTPSYGQGKICFDQFVQLGNSF